MSRDEIEAATIRPPRRGECRHFAASTTTQVFAVPADWAGKKVRFEAMGTDFWVQTAPDDDILIDPSAVDTITGTTLSPPDAAIGEVVLDGTYKEFDFFQADKFCGFVAVGATGFISVRPAEVTLGSE